MNQYALRDEVGIVMYTGTQDDCEFHKLLYGTNGTDWTVAPVLHTVDSLASAWGINPNFKRIL